MLFVVLYFIKHYQTLCKNIKLIQMCDWDLDYSLSKISCSWHTGIWRPPSLSQLTTIVFDMELTHLGSQNSIPFVVMENSTSRTIKILKIFVNNWNFVNFNIIYSKLSKKSVIFESFCLLSKWVCRFELI